MPVNDDNPDLSLYRGMRLRLGRHCSDNIDVEPFQILQKGKGKLPDIIDTDDGVRSLDDKMMMTIMMMMR